jgi:hypothetical protein
MKRFKSKLTGDTLFGRQCITDTVELIGGTENKACYSGNWLLGIGVDHNGNIIPDMLLTDSEFKAEFVEVLEK